MIRISAKFAKMAMHVDEKSHSQKSMSLNIVNLVGRAGDDPEIKRFEPNIVVCKLPLAVDRGNGDRALPRSSSVSNALNCNVITLVGRVGNEPKDDYKVFESGSVKCRLNLAVRRWSREEGEQTDWFNIDAWAQVAELAADQVRKGSLIWVQGSFKVDFWVDRRTGRNRYSPTIVAHHIEVLDGRKSREEEPGLNEMSQPDWFNLELWGRQAEVAEQYVRKGSLIGIRGSLKIDSWQTETGDLRSKPLIRVNQLELLGSKRDRDRPMPAVIDPYQ